MKNKDTFSKKVPLPKHRYLLDESDYWRILDLCLGLQLVLEKMMLRKEALARAAKSDDSSGTLSLLQQLSVGLEEHRNNNNTNRDGTTFFCRLNDEEAARQRREKRNSATPIVKPQRKKSGEIIRPPAIPRPSDTTSTTVDLTSDIEDDDDDECFSDCEESLQGNFYDDDEHTMKKL